MRVLIVAEHASAKFGGEAALPLHYYRVMRRRNIPVWLLSHARVRHELTELYPNDVGTSIIFVEDTALHRILWRLGRFLPDRLAYLTTGFLSRLSTQLQQRRQAREMIRALGIDVVHQPMPVSPREPSLLYNLGAPVVIGPLNGSMNYPPGFRKQEGMLQLLAFCAGRAIAWQLNKLIPGKLHAACLVVANDRTHAALPSRSNQHIRSLVENGVDFTLWKPIEIAQTPSSITCTRFVYLGRLVDWKAVDLLIDAFSIVRIEIPNISLTIVGDGPEGPRLRAMCQRAGILSECGSHVGKVQFTGWKTQHESAAILRTQDVLVLPSLLECGGAVILEAMAVGLAIVATDWGGPADYVDSSCGILVPPTSKEALIAGLAGALETMARNPIVRRTMGHAGRTKVMRDFDWEKKVDRMLEIYSEITACRISEAPP